MPAFEFHPELFEYRSRALACLSDAGYLWLQDFGSIDLLHSEYGFEVCGIKWESSASKILALLERSFPDLNFVDMYYKDFGADEGWKVVIAMKRGGLTATQQA
jgi:hypothetical protein